MTTIEGRHPVEWVARAVLAYAQGPGLTDFPDLCHSGIETVKGLHYVALRNADGAVLAWYRIQNQGQLRRLVYGPRALGR